MRQAKLLFQGVEKMRSSYNVIKSSQVNSNTVYTINAPLLQVKPQIAAVAEECSVETLEDINLKAEEIMQDAREKSERLISSAIEEAERIKKDAYEMSSRKGYMDGQKKGTEDGLKQVEGIRQEALNVLEEAHRVSRQYIQEQKGEIIGLALSIAEKIIHYQADVNDSVITNIVNNAILSAVAKEQILIRVNPMDYAILDCRRDELLKSAGDDRIIISIIRDNDIKRGGCRIDTGISTVDAEIDSQFEKIKEALMGLR